MRERNPQLSAINDGGWERITLIVDSASSDTVLPPKVCRAAEIRNSSKVGTEYEAADGGVVRNLGETPRVRPDPEKPTARERQEHDITHYPYRSWCRHCQRGRGASRPHRARSDADRDFSKGRVPTISLDHCFLGSEDMGPDGVAIPALENPFLICTMQIRRRFSVYQLRVKR